MIQKLFEPAPCACQPEACSRQHGGSLPAGSHPSVPQVPESHVALVSIAFSAPEASTSSQAHVHHHHTACTATVAHTGRTHPGSKAHDDEGAITILEHEVHTNTALAVALESKPVVAAEMSQKAAVTHPIAFATRTRAGIALLALSLCMLYALRQGERVCLGRNDIHGTSTRRQDILKSVQDSAGASIRSSSARLLRRTNALLPCAHTWHGWSPCVLPG